MPGLPDDVPAEARELLVLDPDESVLWSGRPEKRVRLVEWPAIIGAGLFAGGLAWAAFMSAAAPIDYVKSGPFEDIAFRSMLMLGGFGFLALLGWSAVLFVHDRHRLRHTWYAITTRRVISWKPRTWLADAALSSVAAEQVRGIRVRGNDVLLQTYPLLLEPGILSSLADAKSVAALLERTFGETTVKPSAR